MYILSYIWLLALVPLLVEKDDPNVQWHAKHGLIITAAEIVLQIAVWIIFFIIGQLPLGGCVTGVVGCLGPSVVWMGFIVVRVMCIVKATKGERFLIPTVSDLVNKF